MLYDSSVASHKLGLRVQLASTLRVRNREDWIELRILYGFEG